MEHVESDDLTLAECRVRIVVVYCWRSVCLSRLFEPYNLAVEYVSALIYLYYCRSVFKFPFAQNILSRSCAE
jgi:hypothetical protein